MCVLIECKFAGSSESVSKPRSPSEAANMLARMLEQAEGSPTPWEQLVLLIFADIVTTWNFDRQIEPAFESQEVSETALPGGNASMIFAMMAAAGADL